jgi:hypothetical protein
MVSGFAGLCRDVHPASTARSIASASTTLNDETIMFPSTIALTRLGE